MGVLLLVAGTHASALTLGRARGAAWIGQPLELMVPVTVDAGQTDGAVCAEADVFHGDSRIEAGRVQVSVEPTAQADTFNIRIASGTLIDEPVVTVYVRAGCAQKSSRRFVLLADFPSDSGGAPARPATAAALVQPPLVTPVDNTSTKSNWAAANEAANAAQQRAKPVATEKPAREVPKPAPAAKPTPAPAPATAPKAEKAEAKQVANDNAKAATGGTGKARLKLDPLENLTERIKSLESSTVAAPSEEAARDSQRMQQLQGDIKALLDQAAKNESNLMAMRERLEKAESERVPMFVVYALMGLLGVCLAGLAYVWNRKSNRREWQNQYAAPAAPEAHHSPVTEQFDDIPSQVAAERPVPVAAPVLAAKPATPAAEIAPLATKPAPESDPALDDVDVNLMDMDESAFSTLMGVEKPTKKKPVLSDEPQWPVAAVANYDFQSDEVIDIRQQATFFAKLGKVDESIEMLEAAIRNKPENSPFLYLDLLDIATTHSLKTDFRQFRDEFEEAFNVRVPEFAMFKDKGRSVESYPEVQIKLGDVWETPAELATIESLILRNPQVEAGAGLDIAAFTELLELHAAARKRHSVRRAFAETKTATSDFINLKL